MKFPTVRLQGFTIVELLVVIVVIAILAAISVVAYDGVQARATNTSILSMIDTYKKALRLYALDKGTNSSNMTSCLGGVATVGTGGDECFDGSGSYYISPSFDNEIKQYVTFPKGPNGVIAATYGGNTYHFNLAGMYTPYYGQPSIFYGLLKTSACPDGDIESPYDATDGNILCVYRLPSASSL